MEAKDITYADQNNLSTNVSLAKVLEVSAFLNAAENRHEIRFSSDETQFGWVNMPRHYPSTQIRRHGLISELEYQIDPYIGESSYQNPAGETLTVNYRFAIFPIDP
jgi:hypothetical protein